MLVRTLDRKKSRIPNRAERLYGKQLKSLARHVGDIINGFPAGDPEAVPGLTDMLRRYADALYPWATATAQRMLEEVNQKDIDGWRKLAGEISEGVRREIMTAPTGETMRKLLSEQVELIRSIPLEAAQRVHEMTMQAVEDGSRAKELVAEIMRSGEVAQSRAMLIARTEVARTKATLTQARAQHVGSEGYIWRTAHDGDVRSSHKHMAGKFVAWSSPPTLDGMTGHAGCLPNCRCYAEVVLPDD